MVLVGPSGCGKSTLLRMIAGLEEITEGTISIGDVDVTELEPSNRDIAMVFQNYALYPHMSVRENLGFGLSVRRTQKAEIVRRVQGPRRSYEAPRDPFVAAFIGAPSMNLVEATVDGDAVAFGQFRIPLDPARRPAPGVDRVILGVRPEGFDDAAFAKSGLP